MRKPNFKKIVALSLIAGSLIGVVPSSAYACDKTQDCFATGTKVICGRTYGWTTGHQVTDENGYTTWCTVTIEESQHNIVCSGCGAILYTERRICAEKHSHKYCQDKNYLCQHD